LAALAREAALGAAARTHKAAVAAAAAAAVCVSTGVTTAAAQQPGHAANSHNRTAAAGATAGVTAAATGNGTVLQPSDRITCNSSNTATITPVTTAATTADTTAATAAARSTAAASAAGDDSSHSVQLCDFEAAMERVGASSLRGHRVDVPQTLWEHIGGMDEVQYHLNFQNWLSLSFSIDSVYELHCL
jgi:trimeric autotransporter adhesin